MNKKAFTMLEIVFVITIISIIMLVAIPKLSSSLQKADVAKIKSEIVLIRENLQVFKNKHILSNSEGEVDSLEDNSELLFNKILQYPIIASNEKKAGAWSKIDDRTYSVYLDTQNSVEFTFDNLNFTFNCDELNDLCKELNN